MALATVGKAIFELRKARDVTQENVATAVGVSAQAVSKWESGGAPDAELLPAIADFFGVSIDHLFGRSASADGRLETAISLAIADAPREQTFARAFELCWAVQKGVAGIRDSDITPDEVSAKHGGCLHSQIHSDQGVTTMAFDPRLRYFLIMPEPAQGWAQSLPYSDRLADLLAFLGNRNALRAVYFLYGRESKPFTPKLIQKAAQVDEAEAGRILDGLLAHGFVSPSTIELDDEVKTVYNFTNNAAFVQVLALCTELIDKPNSFYYFQGDRTKPYLGE